MIVTKKIYDEKNKNYEFEINITDDINDITNGNTYIIVNDDIDILRVYDAIDNVSKYPGLITLSSSELYNIFNKSKTWNYKYIEEKNIDKLKKQLVNLNSNEIFLSFECNDNYSLFDYEDIINYCIKNNSDSEFYFALPMINNSDKIVLHVFYK